MATTVRIRRRLAGDAGAPTGLASAELAYNMVDGYIYAGFGDDGSGLATAVRAVAHDTFTTAKLVPTGGTTGQVLAKISNSNWALTWTTLTNYTEGDGIDITNGLISIDSVTFPGIDADKVSSGTLSVDRIPSLSANKITSDTFDADRIPSLDAAKIGSGVLDLARIPVLPGNQTIVSSGGIANLTGGQQTSIEEGTIVTTSDGRRWVYSGTGSKTDEASYVEMADITPEWSVIANKPVFATVATSGSYADLSGRPTLAAVATSGSYTDLSNRPSLGTMAAQNANDVTITGGSIDGVILDGGTF